MPDLELALRDLGARLEWPSEPDLAPGVLAGMDRRPVRRRPGSRRVLAVALAVLAVAIGAIFAVPQTRAAVLDFLHLRGVSIERVPELPTVSAPSDLGYLGERVSLDEARRRAGFEVVAPHALGDPDEVYLQAGRPPGGMVSFVYGSSERPRALFTQFVASVDDVVFKKVAPATRIDPVTVAGQPGFWIEGAHFFAYLDRVGAMQSENVRLSGSVLLWEHGTRTLRLEADAPEAEALRIAASVE